MKKIKEFLSGMTFKQKRYAVIMMICVAVNMILEESMTLASAPLCMDVTGTIAATIILEPAAGLIVGLINNFFRAIFINGPTTLVYYSVSAAAALLAAIMLDRNNRLRFGRVIIATALIIAASTLLSGLWKYWQIGVVSNLYWENYFSEIAASRGFGSFLSGAFGAFVIKVPDTIASVILAVIMYKLTPKKYRGR